MTRIGQKFVGRELVVRYLILKGPGRTELELTRAIYGSHLLHSKVGSVCRQLLEEGLIRRTGSGRSGSPYCYWPAP